MTRFVCVIISLSFSFSPLLYDYAPVIELVLIGDIYIYKFCVYRKPFDIRYAV